MQLAHRDFVTPRGYVLSAAYALNPTNGDFSDLVSFYGKLYTPGFAAHNSLTVAATYQTSVGGFRNPAGESFLSYKSARLIPRGFDSNDINSRNYFAASLDYQLPVWYPEGGIPSVLYFKRIRLNLGADYGQFEYGGSIPSAAPCTPRRSASTRWAATSASTSTSSGSRHRPPRRCGCRSTRRARAGCGGRPRWGCRSERKG